MVAWKIRSDVCLRTQSLGTVLARFQNLEKGTGLWISLAEKEKIEGIGLGKNDQVRLSISHGQAGGGFIPVAPADELSNLARREVSKISHPLDRKAPSASVVKLRPIFSRGLELFVDVDLCPRLELLHPAFEEFLLFL